VKLTPASSALRTPLLTRSAWCTCAAHMKWCQLRKMPVQPGSSEGEESREAGGRRRISGSPRNAARAEVVEARDRGAGWGAGQRAGRGGLGGGRAVGGEAGAGGAAERVRLAVAGEGCGVKRGTKLVERGDVALVVVVEMGPRVGRA